MAPIYWEAKLCVLLLAWVAVSIISLINFLREIVVIPHFTVKETDSQRSSVEASDSRPWQSDPWPLCSATLSQAQWNGKADHPPPQPRRPVALPHLPWPPRGDGWISQVLAIRTSWWGLSGILGHGKNPLSRSGDCSLRLTYTHSCM